MYTHQILMLVALPVLIFISYRVILALLKTYEKKFPPEIKI